MYINKYVQVIFILVISVFLVACGEQVNGGVQEDEGVNSELNGAYSDEQEPPDAVVSDYFPLEENRIKNYEGEGIAFPSLERQIMYVEENIAQVLDKRTGTNLVSLYEVSEDQVGLLYEQGEFYADDNLIESMDGDLEVQEVILKAPLEEGASWESNSNHREIVETGMEVTTPFATYENVIKVRTTPLDGDGSYEQYHYYAKDIGLIKEVSDSDGETVRTLELKETSIGLNEMNQDDTDTAEEPVVDKDQAEEQEWATYEDSTLNISFQYPAEWNEVQTDSYEPTRYQGEAGFFEATSIIANSTEDPDLVTPLEEVCDNYAHGKFDPYGTSPKLEQVSVQGQDGCIILSSEDQHAEFDHQAAFIIEYPEPIEREGRDNHYFLLYTNTDHIDSIVESLKFKQQV